MATSVMSTNNQTNNSNNNGIVTYSSTSFNIPPLNNYPIQVPYLEPGIDSHFLHNNQFPFTKSFNDIYGRNQAMVQHQQQQKIDNPLMSSSEFYPQNHQYVNNVMDNQFFSPEHVDGMVSILKGEEDFIHLLDNPEPLSSFEGEDQHSFNPTIVASTPKRNKKRNNEQDEQQVKSPSSAGSSSSNGNNQAESRTSSPTNSQSSPYPNGRKRASKACVECQKRHTRCGFERPCERCVRMGLNCVEMKSTKKRGRATMASATSTVSDSDSTPTMIETKTGQSGKKTKPKSSETKKRKSSPITTSTSEQQTVVDLKPKIPSSQSENQQTSSIITTLTSSSTSTNALQSRSVSSPPLINAHVTLNDQMVEKPLGLVAVGPDFTSVQYVSDPLSEMFAQQPLTRLESIMGSDFIQTQLNVLCEARATRETIISHVDNGLSVLQQSHLKAERAARALIKLKDGKLAEMGIKFVFMYNPSNPSILDSAYIFFNWNGTYYVGNH